MSQKISREPSRKAFRTTLRKPLRVLAAALALPMLAAPAFALQGRESTQDDWYLACDNTGTCRLAGYHAEPGIGAKDYPEPISVLLTREAGEQSPLQGQVAALPKDESDPVPSKLELHINGQSHGSIALNAAKGTLSPEQVNALVEVLLRGKERNIVFSDGKKQWTLSPKGGGSLLLTMDSFQKRTGKPSALGSPGQNEGPVLQPQPKPEIRVAKLPAGAPQVIEHDDARAPALLEVLRKADAQYLEREGDAGDEPCVYLDAKERAIYLGDDGPKYKKRLDITLYPLAEDAVLAVTLCEDHGAYNASALQVVLDAKHTQVRHVTRMGTLDPEGIYADGVITSVVKVRGVGDCMASSKHVWTGQGFTLAEQTSDGLCRNFAGGVWDMPTFVSTIVPAGGQ